MRGSSGSLSVSPLLCGLRRILSGRRVGSTRYVGDRAPAVNSAAQAPDGRSALLRLVDGFARRNGEQAAVAGACGADGAAAKRALRRVRQADRPADSPLQA